MDEGKVVCSNCRQLVVPLGADGPAACCPSCHVRFALPGEARVPPPLVLDGGGRGPPATTPAKGDGKASSRRQRGAKGPWEIVKVVLGGAAGLGIGYLVVFWIQNRNPQEPKPKPRPPQAQHVIARAPSSDKLPEFRSQPDQSPAPIVPAFTPPPIGFSLPPNSSVAPAPSPAPPGGSSAPADNRSKNRGKPQPSHSAASAVKQDLEGLPPALKLPSLVDTGPAVLCPLHVPAGQTLDISLNAVAADIPEEAALLIERDSSVSPSWLFFYAPDLSDAAQEKKPLAVLEHAGGELKFTWRSPIEDAPARKELANCLLRLTCGKASKTAFLRVPQEMPRLRIDLERVVSLHTLPALDPPQEDALRLEIAELTGFPSGAGIRDDKRLLKLKERATIEFAQFQGAEIQLEFLRHPAGELQIVMRPEFRENAAEKIAMTRPRLADLKKGLEKSIPEGEAKLVALRKEAQALEQQLRNLGPRPGGAAFAAWQSKRISLEGSLSSCRSQASRLQRRLPEMKARLSAVPQMENFLNDLHQSGSLTVKVVAECGDARGTIVDARLDPVADR
ncbi:MAG TPA: hypothetical protein VMP01_21755 [Pirellulaceae bacterium]|nr:hypothetical protein [Pirellulaceae bacterium]